MSLRHRLQAMHDLTRHYGAVFRHFWALRGTMRTDFFNQQEAAFLPAGLALQESPASASLRWTARVLMALVGALLLWSVLGKLDIIVNAGGKIIPSARIKTIASVDTAVVRSLHAREGQVVKAGELLVELDTSAQDAERDKADGDRAAALLQAARSQALLDAIERMQPPLLDKVAAASGAQWQAARLQVEGQYRQFRARLAQIDGNIARHAAALPLATRHAEDYRVLAQQHDVAPHAWLEKEQARIDLAGQLAEARHQRAALVAETRREALDAGAEGRRLAAASAQDARRASDHGRLLRLLSPVDGTVQQLAIHTVGGVVPAAQPLMQVVPREDQVEVEAFIDNKDVGFVHEGQDAAVKIDAFDYTRYGTVPATVTHVSRDAIQDEKKGLIYSVRVALRQNSIAVGGRPAALSAGMSASVEIRTGERRIIAYVLSPLVQHQHEALHER
ncbi:HlyD family type I secretion periplasmic adaptor subunit [Noviherbaspirillum suwonense]|uniref:Membrane fusion protein (MFP) family protein n=1 Tax=Noviherbaspirillum suwonense TaxID=1224511 RepID=A0ABY1QR56_9BURK|nr:HlyD family type I secretion periplasmic adaptor subunit [Noviherbaspirillum suwonense]SMP78578.1 hemolysin D [Noviherbaspirillum suwonense]